MNIGKNILATGLVLLLVVAGAHAAVPYENHAYKYKQPNGEVLDITLDGNNLYAEERTADGSLIIFDAKKKGFCYAEVNAAGDQLISTGVLATNTKMRKFNTKDKKQPGLSAPAKARRVKQQSKVVGAESAEGDVVVNPPLARLPNGAVPSEVLGAVQGLTIIVDFPDAVANHTQAEVDSFLNGEEYAEMGNAYSVRGYFRAVSHNQLDYTNTVTRYYRARNNKAYYTDGTLAMTVRSQELVSEALQWLQASEGFDFTTLTRDGDNKFKAINLLYAGASNSPWSKGLWPHKSKLSPQFCANGLCTNYYQISDMPAVMSIGTFIHETGHMLFGWPDLYDYDGSSMGSVGTFCVMGSGASGARLFRPSAPNAYFRHLAGWDAVTELNPLVSLTAPIGRLNHSFADRTLYRWSNPANKSEAFYMEAIHKADANLLQVDSGLAIYHIDPSGSNSTEEKPFIQLEHADGQRHPENNVNKGDLTDLYDGVATKAFSNVLPNALAAKGTNSKWWNGFGSGFALYNISAPAERVSFDVGTTYSGSLNTGAEAIHPAPYFKHLGPIKAYLNGPAGADFNLILEKSVNNVWQVVASGVSATADESIDYQAAYYYYRIKVKALAGSGSYTLTVVK
ncbi:MAG: M6 family metalloprotease domain-containing protein [Pseudomonadota bacterium]